MSARAQYLGVKGVVLDGRVRDLEEQRGQKFPVSIILSSFERDLFTIYFILLADICKGIINIRNRKICTSGSHQRAYHHRVRFHF